VRSRNILTVAASIVILIAVTDGCKEGDPISDVVSPATASFAAESPPEGMTDHLVELRSGGASGGRITLDVVLTEIDEPITGIVLKLTYPDAFSKFVSCSDGSLFPTGTCYYDEPSSGSGEVFVGRAITGVAQAVPVAGSEIVVRMEFLVFGVGEGEIRIEAQNLGGSDASAVLDVNGDPVFMHWYAGMLIGT
jgi:hypothetical protein